MPRRYYSSTAIATTLSSNASNSATSITVTALSGYPAQTPWTGILSPDTASEEVVTVTNVSGTTLTVTRGVDGTTASSHNAGAVFRHGVSARDFDEANAFINASGEVAFQASAPSSPNDGDVWIDSDSTVSTLNPADYVQKSLIQGSKGSLAVGTGSTVAAQAVGANNTLLVADSAQTNGIRWSATLSGLTLTSPVANTPIVVAPEERCNVVASAATGTISLNFLTAAVWFYTSNASANHTLNIRGDASNTLNSLLAVGDSITVVWMNTNGTTAYYPNVIQIDGTNVTPRWQGGTAPTSGNASSTDVYTFTIIKTASTPTYTVLGSQTRFA